MKGITSPEKNDRKVGVLLILLGPASRHNACQLTYTCGVVSAAQPLLDLPYGIKTARPRTLPADKSSIAFWNSSSLYFVVWSTTFPCAAKTISSARSLYEPTRLPMKLISVEMISIVGMLRFSPYPGLSQQDCSREYMEKLEITKCCR